MPYGICKGIYFVAFVSGVDMPRCRALVSLFVLSFLLFGSTASAQIDTGTIVGRVTDASGGVLPGVSVTATQQGTGVASNAVTNANGEFIFPGLRVGAYEVAAELRLPAHGAGERAVERADRAQVDLQLSVGAVSEEVTVTGRSELLQTQTADIGTIVDQRQVQDLPLLGRRYSELAFLTPGVVAAPAGISSRGEDTFFNANGNYATWNNYTLDGADNNSFSTNLQERSPQVVSPPVDALQEFKVQTRTYSAEFGKAAGAVINASVKQGTNKFSGSLFAFLRDESLNANTWDNNRAGRPKGPFNQLIAGGTFGGPIVRGRTFFFGDYQSSRTERSLSQTATVPTAPHEDRRSVRAGRQHGGDNAFVPAGCVDAVNKTISRSCFDRRRRGCSSCSRRPTCPALASSTTTSSRTASSTTRRPVRHPRRSPPWCGQRFAVRALQLPEHRPRSSRRCSKTPWPPATSRATS